MNPLPVKPENFLYLQDNGIDIDAYFIDYKMISVRCEDLSLYRKAFRVKIRALIKQNKMAELKRYVNQFYKFAHFVQFLYGFHSCACAVQAWQEQLACVLQAKFVESDIEDYQTDIWISYKSVDVYSEFFKLQYIGLFPHASIQTLQCIQDAKPFLNLKDRAHFNQCLNALNG